MLTELLVVCLKLGFYRALCVSPGSPTLSPHHPHTLGLITPTASFWAHQPGSHVPGPSLGPPGQASRNRGRAGDQVAPRGAKGPASTTPGSLEREQRQGHGATCGRGTVARAPRPLPCFLGLPPATAPRAPAFLGRRAWWACPPPEAGAHGDRQAQHCHSGWGSRPERLRRVGGKWTAGLGAAGPRCPSEWGLPQRSGPDLGLTVCPLLFPAPSCFPGIPELQTQRVWDSRGLPLATVTSDPGRSVLTEAHLLLQL